MNKSNIFKSSSFFMNEGDTLHMIIIDETGQRISIQLIGSGGIELPEDGTPESPIALPATNVGLASFSANWEAVSGATGYCLDVSTSSTFATFVAGYEDLDVGNILTLSIGGLSNATPYYYRIRAYNGTDTSTDSNTITLTTEAAPVGPLLDIDGNEYSTVIIGTQEWIVENFRATHYADGTDIPNLTADADWIGDTSEANKDIYGGLYNWYAATYNTGGASIAPAGWHVPTQAEFSSLITYIGGAYAGLKLREIGNTHWDINVGATDEFGFTSLGAGYRRNEEGSFFLIKNAAQYWSSGTSGAYGVFLSNTGNDGWVWVGELEKPEGNSIRLIKDDDTDPGTMTDIDGNVYNTVKIGTQVWMAENLKVEHFNNGVDIPIVTGDAAWAALSAEGMCYYNNLAYGGAYCWYENDEATYKADYGALYNWYAVDNPNELAYLERNATEETGWRVPTLTDFTALSTYLGGEAISGGKLKETGLVYWDFPNAGADNSSGFTGRGGGERSNADGDWAAYITQIGGFWGSNMLFELSAYTVESAIYNNIVLVKGTGCSVRLVRDITLSSQYVIFDDGSDIYRKGVRFGSFVIDYALTVTGFAGDESLDDGLTGDWINLKSIS